MHHDGDEKEWGNLGAQALTPSPISYKPQINIRIVQVERPGEGALREREKSNGGKNIDRKAQWVGINGRAGEMSYVDCLVFGLL